MLPGARCRTRTSVRIALALTLVTAGSLSPTAAWAQDAEESPSLLCPDEPPETTLNDRDDVSDTHLDAVECLFALGITSGLGSDEGVRYLPDADVRRDQMATFVVHTLEAAGAGLPAGDTGRFEDVDDANVHQRSIAQLAATGIVKGTTATTYAPDGIVTRDAMASFLVRATAWYQDRQVDALEGGPTRFGDIEGNVHADAIAGTYHLGIAQGVASDVTGARYAPDQPVTREQMASFLVGATAAMLNGRDSCVNHELAATVTYPDGWATNPGTVLPRCTLFDDQRFVPEPGSEIASDLPIRLLAADVSMDQAENDAREQIERTPTTVDGRDAVFLRQRTTEDSDELLPAGVEVSTYLVELPAEASGTTLIASTNSTADDHARNRDVLDDLMEQLRFTVPARVAVAAYGGGGRPFSVAAFPGADGVCTQAQAGRTTDTVCVESEQMHALELRAHVIDEQWTIHAGSVDPTIDTVRIVPHDGEPYEPELTSVGDRLVYASPIAQDDMDVVEALRDGEVVAEGDLPE